MSLLQHDYGDGAHYKCSPGRKNGEIPERGEGRPCRLSVFHGERQVDPTWASMGAIILYGRTRSPTWYIEQCIEPRVDGFPTPSGLQIQLPGFLCDPDFLHFNESFDTLLGQEWLPFKDQHGVWFFFQMLGPWNQSRTEDPLALEQLAILLVRPVTDLKDTVDDPFNFVPGIQAVIGVVSPGDHDHIPHFQGYRHGLLHRYSVAFQHYLEAIAACVENFVSLECYGWEGSEKEEENGEHATEDSEGEMENETAKDTEVVPAGKESKTENNDENEGGVAENNGYGDEESQKETNIENLERVAEDLEHIHLGSSN